ncbi:MAG: pentapeptide repeat-containing protein [Cyanobacteria bacterium P01_F01_bin.86]
MKTQLQRQRTAIATPDRPRSDRATQGNITVQNQMAEETTAQPVDVQMQRASQMGHSLGNFTIQPALVIGEPGDKYEQEADAVAHQAMQMKSDTTQQSSVKPHPQRKPVQRQPDVSDMEGDLGSDAAMPDTEMLDAAPISSDMTASGEGGSDNPNGGSEGGSPPSDADGADENMLAEVMPPETQDQLEAADINSSGTAEDSGTPGGETLESRLQKAMSAGGQSLSDEDQQLLRERIGIANPEAIVIHNDQESYELCELLGARAFTTSNHIFFGEGEYGDQELLFHEATHCIQQGAVGTTEESQDVDQASADPEESTLTPDQDAGGITEIMPTAAVQRAAKEGEEKDTATESEPAPQEQAEKQGEDTQASGEQQKDDAVQDQEPKAEQDAGDGQPVEVGGQMEAPTPETPSGGASAPEKATAPTKNEEVGDIPEEIDADEIADESESLGLGPTLEAEVPGYATELQDYNAFQEAKEADSTDSQFWMDFLDNYDATAALTEQFDAEAGGLSSGALIGEALGLGLAEGAIQGVLTVGLAKGMEKLGQKFPKTAAGIGAVLTIATFAMDPEGWFEENFLSFGEHAKDIAAIGSIGDASSFWEGAAILMEFFIGILSMVRQVVDTITNILNLIWAVLFILAAIAYGIGSALAAAVFTAPAAPPFFTAATTLFSWGNTIMGWTKPLGVISLYLTLPILGFRALAMLFRIADIATYEGDPKTLLEKKQKLQGHVKDLIADGATVAASYGDIKEGIQKPGAKPNLGNKPEKMALETDMEFAERMGKYTDRANRKMFYSYEKDDSTGKFVRGGSEFATGTAGVGGETIGDFGARKANDAIDDAADESEQSQMSELQEEHDRDEILPRIAARITSGADELPPPPSEDLIAVAATSEAITSIEAEKQTLMAQKMENQALQQDAMEATAAFSILEGAAQFNQNQIGLFQGQLSDKQVKQDDAVTKLQDVQQAAGEAQGQSDKAQGMLGSQKSNIETGMQQGAAQGAEPEGAAASPDQAIGGSGDASSGAKDGGVAAQAGQQQMQQNKQETQKASSEAAIEDAKLEGFKNTMQEKQDESTSAVEESQELDTEIDDSINETEAQEEEMLAQREAATSNLQAWVEEHNAEKESILEDLVDIIEAELGSEEAEELAQDEDKDLTNDEDNDQSEKNLVNAQLSGFNLAGVSFASSDLSGADLSGADLTDADLSEADLSGADLKGANLTGANFEEAKLNDADLTGADLNNANFEEAETEGAIGLST